MARAGRERMFANGFFADVYQERPLGSSGVGKIITRFPPEPNGFLHLGHAKAMLVNFGFASYHDGECNLRYDDTNPIKEEAMFYHSIQDTVTWLGFKPTRITYASDHFDELYNLAERLIEVDKAYVCHCSEKEIQLQRGVEGNKKGGERYACPHHDRPISESLAEFRRMKDGFYEYQGALLRMRQDISDSNPQMWDLIAYRVSKSCKPHFRTGSSWKIYPTYDFAHCLCDSFERITHSLCTTEFERSRQSYDWLIEALDVYKPMQREYGRLNLDGVVLSKRKLEFLIDNKIVQGWDDPRIYTLMGIRRRGVPPGAIISFVQDLGVTKANTSIRTALFEQHVRKYLENTVPRLMVVVDPIKVTIENLPDKHLEMCEVPFSKDPAMGNHSVPFTKIVYIDRSDFREVDSKDYFRLAPGKSVGLLKVPHPITALSFEKDEASSLVTSVRARYEVPASGERIKKPKTYVHWIADSPEHSSPIRASARYLNALFTVENPKDDPDILSTVNPLSQVVYPSVMVDIRFEELKRRAPWPAEAGESNVVEGTAAPESMRFQGMRTAYFCVDKDTGADGSLMLNRIVSLKEDSGKS